MKIRPTLATALLAGTFTGVAMPLLWPHLGDDTLHWIGAFLLGIALPAHAFVVGFDAAGARDPVLPRRIAAWLAAAVLAAGIVHGVVG